MPMPKFTALGPGVGQFYKGKGKDDLKDANLRVIAFGENETGLRVMYDCAVETGKKDEPAVAAT